MFGIGETELVIIVLFGFMLFGPDKLPGMGRTIGRVLRQFREASDGFTEVVQTNIMDPASEELEKSPKQRRREQLEDRGEQADGADEVTDGGAVRRETFAERRARLAAERAAQQAQEHEASAEDASGGDAQSAGSKEDEAPQSASATDLYAMTGTRKSSRTQAGEDEALNKKDGEEAGNAEA